MVQQGPAFSAFCASTVEELHLTFSFLVAYSPNRLPLFNEKLYMLYQVYGKCSDENVLIIDVS